MSTATDQTHYLLIGVGAIGLPLANRLAANGYRVTAVSRTPKADLATSVTHLCTDARTLRAAELGQARATISHVVIIVTPTGTGEQAYRDSYLAIAQAVVRLGADLPNLQRVVYVSSTGVYGQHAGERIDINTPIAPPTSATHRVLLQTEQTLQAAFGARCTIVRASGIYGRKRRRLLAMARDVATGARPAPTNNWSNRIMDSDLVNALYHIVTAAVPLPVYLATDSHPVALHAVLALIAAHMGLKTANFATDSTPTTGKRLYGNLPADWLTYPNYQTGYRDILADDTRDQA